MTPAANEVLPEGNKFTFQPREYQLPILEYMANGGLRAVLCWHRRAGKDLTIFNMLVTKALQRVGTYFYLLPTYAQAKKIIWDGMIGDGRAFRSFVPSGIGVVWNENEMQCRLPNGSVIQLVGTDNIDRVVGTNPIGCVFSEYALQDSRAWELISPILAENGGWAIFISTPRGRNHFYELYNFACTEPGWFAQRLTVDDTKNADGSPVITRAKIDALIRQGQDPDLVEQEYYCSFEGAVQGAYYSSYIKVARSEGRIATGEKFEWDARYPVRTVWDLGVGDDTAIIFYQRIGPWVRIIDTYANRGLGVEHYAKVVHSKPYKYSRHFAPHDVEGREWGTGDSRIRQAAEHGIHFTVVKKAPVDDGIAAVRRIFWRLLIHEKRNNKFLDAITFYHRERTDKGASDADPENDKAIFADKPSHDWSSHYADSLRYLAQAEENRVKDGEGTIHRQVRAETAWGIDVKETAQFETTDSDYDVLGLER